jgi:phosphoglycolate phosphatase-like HAD superfamily hydrolase
MKLCAVLFWDLDGTLLLTGRAGLYAFEEALE